MLSVMGASNPFFVVVVAAASLAASSALGQTAKAKAGTKAPVSITFEAHNESIEGDLYGNENLVSVTIDGAGIRYQAKGADKPQTIPWTEVSGWRANNFTSFNKPDHILNGDFGIGIYQNQLYFSFRTRNGRDYTAANKALRAFASQKERPGE
jgi:hypothetical protein